MCRLGGCAKLSGSVQGCQRTRLGSSCSEGVDEKSFSGEQQGFTEIPMEAAKLA